MTIFSKNTLPLRRKGKNANNLSEANINMNTEEVSRFDAWFTSSYTRLKNKIASFSKVDEDTFHNTYLFIKNILVLRNAFEKTRKQMKVNALSINVLSDNLNFPMFAKLTLKKT